MNYPGPAQCRRVYRWIQAYTAIRTSTRVGKVLRIAVGKDGDIAALSPSALDSKFSGNDRKEARRLVALAVQNQRRIRRDENQNHLPDNR